MKQLFKNLFPALYGLLVFATIRLLQDTSSGFKFWQRKWQQNALEIGFSIAIGYLVVIIANRLWQYFDNRISAQAFHTNVLWRELFYLAVINICLFNLVLTPMAAFTDDGLSRSDLAFINIVPLLFTFIYYGFVRSRKYLAAYVEHKLLVEKLTNNQLQTELRFLKAQFHPHFLFNALNTIYFQMDDDVFAAKQSVETLSELLRYQLYDQQQKVVIEQELHYVEKYMALQKTRTSKRLCLQVQFSNDLKNQLIYPLLFLPLVENAFKYVGGKYEITITAELINKNLLFTVVNALPDKLEIQSANAGGIGLENLKRRLELLYPDKHKLATNKQDDYFIAELQVNDLYGN